MVYHISRPFLDSIERILRSKIQILQLTVHYIPYLLYMIYEIDFIVRNKSIHITFYDNPHENHYLKKIKFANKHSINGIKNIISI
jgi:hypothetical protein